MTVAELIAELKKQPQDVQVIVYSHLDEGADWAHGVICDTTGNTRTHDERPRPYVKGDWPDYGETATVVIIK